jgi:hypothetical protein
LKISRDNWKTRAKESEKRVKELEKRLEKRQQTRSKTSEVSPKEILIEDLTKVPGHHYAV